MDRRNWLGVFFGSLAAMLGFSSTAKAVEEKEDHTIRLRMEGNRKVLYVENASYELAKQFVGTRQRELYQGKIAWYNVIWKSNGFVRISWSYN